MSIETNCQIKKVDFNQSNNKQTMNNTTKSSFENENDKPSVALFGGNRSGVATRRVGLTIRNCPELAGRHSPFAKQGLT